MKKVLFVFALLCAALLGGQAFACEDDCDNNYNYFLNCEFPCRGRVATILLALSDSGASDAFANKLVSNTVYWAAQVAHPRVLLVLDDNHHGEHQGEIGALQSWLNAAGVSYTFVQENLFRTLGMTHLAANYDVVWFVNPGWPFDDFYSFWKLKRFSAKGKGVVLQGDDMSWYYDEFTNVNHGSNGTRTCGLRTDNNKGYSYHVFLDGQDHDVIDGLTDVPFSYGNDIDHSEANDPNEVLVWASFPEGECEVLYPVVIVRESEGEDCPDPVDCDGTWRWSDCSVECGGGVKTGEFVVATYPAFGGQECPASPVSKRCNTNPCPVDCEGYWTEWTECSADCGGATQTRSFVVTTQPAHGGEECPATTETRKCNVDACQCLTGEWSAWGPECPTECGTEASQVRTREVYQIPAEGDCPSVETRACPVIPCPVDCEVSEWICGECSASCGPSTKTCRRSVVTQPAHGGAACPDLTKTEDCCLNPCVCEVSEWSAWGPCSAECGNGTQTRTRTVLDSGDGNCPPLSEAKECYAGKCPPVCGDGTCDVTESCETCEEDCGECPPTPSTCGDGTCDSTETCDTCPADCGECPSYCGDGTCDENETCESCESDCGECLIKPKDPEDDPELNIVGGGGCNVNGNGTSALGLFLILGVLAMVRFRKLFGFLAALLLVGGISVADAAPPVNTLRSAPTSHDYFNTMRPETLEHLGVNARLNLRYDERPVRLVTRLGNDTVAHVVDGRINMDVAVALGLWDRLEVGLLIPTTLYTNPGTRLDVLGVDGDYVKRGDLGDLRVATKAHLLDYKWFDLSLALPVTLPTGDVDRLTGENGFTVEPTLVFGVSTNRLGVSANVGYRARNAQNVAFGNQDVRFDDELTYGIGARLTLVRDYDLIKTLDLVGDVWGAMSIEEQNQEELPLEAQAGLRVHTTPGFLAGLSAGGGLTRGYGTPEYRVMATIGWDFGGPEPCPTCKPRVVRETVEKVVTKVVEKVKVVDRIVVFPMVYFDTDKSDLRPDAVEALDEVVRILNENSNIRRIRLEGHCDRRASDKYNDALAQRRLASVLTYLHDHGISLKRVEEVRAWGESLANQDADTAEELQLDRRVEFKVLEIR